MYIHTYIHTYAFFTLNQLCARFAAGLWLTYPWPFSNFRKWIRHTTNTSSSLQLACAISQTVPSIWLLNFQEQSRSKNRPAADFTPIAQYVSFHAPKPYHYMMKQISKTCHFSSPVVVGFRCPGLQLLILLGATSTKGQQQSRDCLMANAKPTHRMTDAEISPWSFKFLFLFLLHLFPFSIFESFSFPSLFSIFSSFLSSLSWHRAWHSTWHTHGTLRGTLHGTAHGVLCMPFKTLDFTWFRPEIGITTGER